MKLRGLLALLAGIILFSTIEVTSKLMQIGGGNTAGKYPFWLAFFRFFGTGVILFIPAMHRLRRNQIRLTGHDLKKLAGLGVVGVTLMSGLYHLSLTYLPANVAALVFSCNPVFVVLFAPFFLSEKITVRKLIAVGLCLSGILILAKDHTDGISVTGLWLMLVAIITFAFYTIFFKKMTPRYGALPVTAFASLFGGLPLLLIACATEGVPLAAYGAGDWIGIAWLTIFATAIAYFLYIYGINHVEAGTGSMAFFLKPFLAALFAWMVLGETLTIPLLIGAALILTGMVIALVPARRGNNKPVPMD